MNMKRLIIICGVVIVTCIGLIIWLWPRHQNVPNSGIIAREFMPNEIITHATATDCWTSIGGNVYDLSNYFNKNPDDILSASLCGKVGPNITLPSKLKLNTLLAYQIGILAVLR
jgi:hypothetical protein